MAVLVRAKISKGRTLWQRFKKRYGSLLKRERGGGEREIFKESTINPPELRQTSPRILMKKKKKEKSPEKTL